MRILSTILTIMQLIGNSNKKLTSNYSIGSMENTRMRYPNWKAISMNSPNNYRRCKSTIPDRASSRNCKKNTTPTASPKINLPHWISSKKIIESNTGRIANNSGLMRSILKCQRWLGRRRLFSHRDRRRNAQETNLQNKTTISFIKVPIIYQSRDQWIRRRGLMKIIAITWAHHTWPID